MIHRKRTGTQEEPSMVSSSESSRPMTAGGTAKTMVTSAPVSTDRRSRRGSMVAVTTVDSPRPGDLTEGAGQAQLPRVEDPLRVESGFDVDERAEGVSQGGGHEPGPVQPDAMVVAEGTAPGQHGPGAGVPHLPVEGVLGLRGRLRATGEGEV